MNFDDRQDQLEADLVPKLTPEFLAVLVQAVRTHAWMGDVIETESFARYCHRLAGRPIPEDMEPLNQEGE